VRKAQPLNKSGFLSFMASLDAFARLPPLVTAPVLGHHSGRNRREVTPAITDAPMIDPQLKDKVVLITGANNPHGIGAATARALAEQRSRLFLHYFRAASVPPQLSEQGSAKLALSSPGAAFYNAQLAKSADEVLASLRKLGAEAHALEADLADTSLIPRLFDEAERSLGPVEIVINNAAAWEGDTFVPSGAELANQLFELWTDRPASISPGSFDRLFAVNTRAPALIMAEFARRHIQRKSKWGRIINISTAGADRFPSEITYGAAKFALESYTRSAACELGKFGITVNVLSLGPVQTGWITPELEREILPTIPLGRMGHPDDVADVIVFLVSHQARWITGQRIYVGGGHGM
jgi:3-oxoacyl-[acyl-carrier protein] reductase